MLAVGLSCALWWVNWRWLQPAVSGWGQPYPLLSEAPEASDSPWAPAPNAP